MNNTINGRTPDEIKKGLECCPVCSKSCAYYRGVDCYAELHYDALAYIQQLERERDAAIKALRGVYSECIHFNSQYHPGDIMSCCKFEECIHGADNWESEDHWQWRGVQEVE